MKEDHDFFEDVEMIGFPVFKPGMHQPIDEEMDSETVLLIDVLNNLRNEGMDDDCVKLLNLNTQRSKVMEESLSPYKEAYETKKAIYEEYKKTLKVLNE